MKYLFCLRGCPASGKSTFITQHRSLLKPYVLSTDEIRRLFPYMTNIDGTKSTSIYYEDITWKILFGCLEKRMQVDNYVIIDATHYKLSSISQYDKLAQKYGFQIIIVDFYSGISLQVLKSRNKEREIYKRVPEEVIDKMYNVLQQSIKTTYRIIQPQEMIKVIENKTDNTDKCKTAYNIKELLYKGHIDILFYWFPILKQMVGFDQQNKYHSKDLWNHTIDVVNGLPTNIEDDMIYWAALFHDIGKLYTKQLGSDGDCHYFNHGAKSCEIVRNQVIPELKKVYDYSNEDYERLLRFILYHDLSFPKVEALKKYYEKGFKNKDELRTYLCLQLSDLRCHNIIKSLVGKEDIVLGQLALINKDIPKKGN